MLSPGLGAEAANGPGVVRRPLLLARKRQGGWPGVDHRQDSWELNGGARMANAGIFVIERSGILLGRVRRIRICRRLLRALRRHFCRRWLAGNTTRSKQLLLDVILGLAWQSIIKLARFTEYQHLLTPDFLLSPGDFNRR